MAVQIEHPDGIPLAKGWSQYGSAMNGNLLLVYEPPYINESMVALAIVGRINNTSISFSGTLSTEMIGGPLVPKQNLISSVQSIVKDMAIDMKISNTNTLAIVMEEILNYCVVNVPVRQVYDNIRLNFPKEFRYINLEYKRRYGKTIDESMSILRDRQQVSHRYGYLKMLTKTAFKKHDIVSFDADKLRQLEIHNPDIFAMIEQEMKKISPIRGKFIVYNDSERTNVGNSVKLVGLDPKNKKSFIRTDQSIPDDALEIFNPEEEESDNLDWMSDEDKEEFGIDSEPMKDQQAHTTNTPINKEDYQFLITIHAWAKKYSQNSQKSGMNFKNPKGVIGKVKLEAFQIPGLDSPYGENVYTNKKLAQQYAGKIIEIYKKYSYMKYQISDAYFLALYEYLTQK